MTTPDTPSVEPPQDTHPAEPPQDSPPAEPPNSVPPPPPESGGGILGFVKAHMMITAIVGVVAIAIVVVIVVVIVVFSTGLVGSGGGGGGGGGGQQDYILEDSSYVTVVNVAAILDSVEIPAQLWDLGDSDHDDPEEWKDQWREGFSDDDLYIPRMIRDDITLDDIQYGVFQEDADGRDLGWLLIGSFSFEDIRDALEDEDLEDGKYRDFEVWGDRRIALLEDQGAIILDQSLVEDVLKALDTGRGSISQGEPGDLKRGLG